MAKTDKHVSAIAYQYDDLYERASKDALSGLLNRATIELYIKERISSMNANETCALFIVDLDNFKKVNDTLGHIAGDEAIKESAEILSSVFRAKDIVGRLGGDEFIAFISGDITPELVERIGSDICSKLQLTLGTGSTSMVLTASVGIYMSDGKAEFEGMYQSADLALYKAKKSGKHCFYIKLNDHYQKGFSPVNAIPVGSLLDAIDSGIALLEVTEDINIIFASRSFSRLLGLDNLDLPTALNTVIHPHDYAILSEEILLLIAKGTDIERTIRVVLHNGSFAWWRIKISNYEYDSKNPIAILSAHDVSEFKEKEGKLEDINERLRTAINQTDVELWEVDIKKKVFILYDDKKREIRSYTFPDGLIKEGAIHHNSKTRFLEFSQDLLQGQSQGYGNFILKNAETGAYNWSAISYRMIYDADGMAIRAVGISETLSNTFKSESSGSVSESLLPGTLLSDLIERVRLNLTKDSTEEVWLGGHNLSDDEHSQKASEILMRQRENIFREDDKRGLLSYFEIPTLLKLYDEGKLWRAFVYQRADSGGNVRTVRHVFHILKAKDSDDIYLNAYIVRINIEKELESLSLQPLELDNDTGFYNEDTFGNIARTIFDSKIEGKSSIAAFQIEGLSALTHIDAAKAKVAITAALSIALGGSSILGLYGEDKIIIILPGEYRRAEIKKRFEDAFSFIRRTVEYTGNLRFVVAIATKSTEKSTYDILLSSVLYLLSLWWNASSDMITFSQDGEEGFVELESDHSEEKIVLLQNTTDSVLTDSEKDVAVDCMSAMLSAKSLESSVDSVLKIIGIFYDAERSYILNLAGGDRILTMPYEWTAPNKRPIAQIVSGMTVERFPLIKRCIQEKAPIVLNRAKSDLSPEDARQWSFIVFPIHQDKGDGFLCIENPKKNIENVSIISTLIPYIVREADRFDKATDSAAAEELMGVPDLRSFMDFIPTLTSENYSSLGAVCIDIPGMAAINSSFGFEYGSKLLWYVSKILLEIFRANLVFRTWDAEFVAFLPNTTEQVFSSKCNRLRLLIHRKYPRDVRIGKAWNDGSFKGRKLVEDARVNMRSDQSYASTPYIPFILNKENERKEILRDAGADDFIVYYQPKIDMKTKKVVGAESLVRGLEKDGSIIFPAAFIPKLEEKGGIRELDLLVLEKTLNDLYQWKREGFEILPVSVNLSRVTLLYPSTLASLLAIESRYSDDITSLIEFEITENSGVLENEEFKKIVEHFRDQNFKISLDDFGSHYANLSLLANVVFDTIKLDRSLVANIADNQINMMLVHDIIQICKKRGMGCIAEGVETEEQQNSLISAGCRLAQGYLYDRPLAKGDFEEKYLRRIN